MTGVTGPKFIVDSNVGKLAKWLRMMGYDTIFFDGTDDAQMIALALAEGRIILTRDTRIMKRRLVTSGQLKAILIESDVPAHQIRQVIDTLHLDYAHPFTICLECNQPLAELPKEQAKGRVPPYVFQTQEQYVECSHCHRIYWRGTHWQAMTRKMERLGQNLAKGPATEKSNDAGRDVREAGNHTGLGAAQ
ncbi:MAG: Mut7-C RNAse domain-containing protein [Chloroflexi bacterium]|nr:Mut7-C RNAse domain-containing protein [Chloroflexota bacterium]